MTEASSAAFTSFLLGQFRVAAARIELMANEVDFIGTALSAGFVSAADAITLAAEAGVLDLFTSSSSVITPVST